MIRVAQTPAVNHNFAINFGHPLNLVSPLVSYGTAANWTRSPPSVFRKFFAVKQTRFFFRAKLWANQRGILDRRVDRRGVRSVGTGVDNGISSKETLTANVEFGAGEEATVQFSG